MISTRNLLMHAVATLAYSITCTNAFTSSPFQATPHALIGTRPTTTELSYNSNNDDDHEVFDLDTLEQRIGKLRLKILEEDLMRPPNANLKPKEFVESLLEGIFYNEDPRPDAGFMLLLRCSTDKWISSVLQSIGAPEHANLETAAAALGTAIGRPKNQYAILVGGNEDDGDDEGLLDEQGDRNFYVHFPSETLDFLDGTAWVNVEFRSKADNGLLVLTGWQLCQRPDGAWLVDQIDWQDYREQYRPGIGREDWMPFEGRRR